MLLKEAKDKREYTSAMIYGLSGTSMSVGREVDDAAELARTIDECLVGDEPRLVS